MEVFSDHPFRIFFEAAQIQPVKFHNQSFAILRDDLIHPIISGNKLRKLWLYLMEAMQHKKGIETYGGPYSNHLVATAYATNVLGIASRAYIRGGHLRTYVIDLCERWNMQTSALDKSTYAAQKNENRSLAAGWLSIPEGGKGMQGVEGVKCSYGNLLKDYNEIWLAAGTLTTALGVARAAPHARVVAVPVLKATGEDLLKDFVSRYSISGPENLAFSDGVHFGGYARWTPELLDFANTVYLETGIMTDLVYTAKSLYAMVHERNSPSDVGKLWIHTGGLQGMMGILPQIKKKNLHLSYETPLVAHLTDTHLVTK